MATPPGVAGIAAYHGWSCAESRNPTTQTVLTLDDSQDISGFTDATVFLNGWHLTYLNADHHVGGLGTIITDIKTERGKLSWQAMGAISDQNFDDPYKWCYYYTIVAWNAANINLTIDQDGYCGAHDDAPVNFFLAGNQGFDTALASFPRFLRSDAFAASPVVALLPRGFGFIWNSGTVFAPPPCTEIDDHHILQLAYHLGPSEIFAAKGKAYRNGAGTLTPLPFSIEGKGGQVDSNFVSWESQSVFKDDDSRRDYSLAEMVSGMGGADVGVIQPAFSVLPIEHQYFTDYAPSFPDPHANDPSVIQNVPYEFAVPMLTGWDLFYAAPSDHHVRDVGIWLDGIAYQKPAAAPFGTLSYKLSSVLRDDDNNVSATRHGVTVLGFRKIAANRKANGPAPDLLPFNPSGAAPTALCRHEQDSILRITVKNQGDAVAIPSRTTVTIQGKPFTLDTPAVPAAGAVDLLFKLPPVCLTTGCAFTVVADAQNQVAEGNESNNSANGACPGH